jgi:hypothetical protein
MRMWFMVLSTGRTGLGHHGVGSSSNDFADLVPHDQIDAGPGRRQPMQGDIRSQAARRLDRLMLSVMIRGNVVRAFGLDVPTMILVINLDITGHHNATSSRHLPVYSSS